MTTDLIERLVSALAATGEEADCGNSRGWPDGAEQALADGRAFVAAARAGIAEPQAQGAPHGWKLVPVEPTEPTLSQKMAAAGFTRRPSLWAMQAREALELIAMPMRPDGSWNHDREACRQLAVEALGRDDEVPAAPQPAQARDRNADRARFPDPDFNRWLDEGPEGAARHAPRGRLAGPLTRARTPRAAAHPPPRSRPAS